jgi:hypothetical protein
MVWFSFSDLDRHCERSEAISCNTREIASARDARLAMTPII